MDAPLTVSGRPMPSRQTKHLTIGCLVFTDGHDPDLNPTYQEFAVHYGMGVVPEAVSFLRIVADIFILL